MRLEKKSEQYIKHLESYIKIKKPYVIAVNPDVKINNKFIDAYAMCNPLKIIGDLKQYSKIKSPIITPKSNLSQKVLDKLKKNKILDFGAGIKENYFKFGNNGAVIPRLYTFVYALAVATSGNCNRILLAGFDGYGNDDYRTKVINDIFNIYILSKKSKPLMSITPTSYSIKSRSILSF